MYRTTSQTHSGCLRAGEGLSDLIELGNLPPYARGNIRCYTGFSEVVVRSLV